MSPRLIQQNNDSVRNIIKLALSLQGKSCKLPSFHTICPPEQKKAVTPTNNIISNKKAVAVQQSVNISFSKNEDLSKDLNDVFLLTSSLLAPKDIINFN